MFYGPKSIENSLKILSKNRSIKGCCSFGIELHQNKYLDKFYYLLFKKSKVTTANDYLINNLKNIISPFHKNYIVDYGLPTNFNFFIFHKINNYFFLKTFDYHPLIMRIKNEVRFNENEPIDYKFIRKNDFNKWHIEKDLLKISCFSITDNFLQRNYFRKYKNLNLTKKKLSYLFYKCIYYNINKFCNNKKDFYNNYFYLKNSKKKINHSNVNKIINLNIKKDNIQNMFNNFFLILKLLCDIRLLKTLLMLIITGKKKYLVSSNIFNNDKLILLKSLTSLVFNTIFNR